jgi:acid phosphatase
MRFFLPLALCVAAGCNANPGPLYGNPGTGGDGPGGVGSGGAAGSGEVDAGAPPLTDGGAPPDLAIGPLRTVFTIVLENHTPEPIIGSKNAPYINSLAAEYGLATNYKDSGTHPSLPNYLYLVSGDTQYLGIVDLDPTNFPFPVDKENLGHQLTANGIPWRAYAASAGTSCALASTTTYAARHDPFLYFTDIQKDPGGLCAAANVDYSNFADDLAADQYRYLFLAPDVTATATLAQSDAWLKDELPKILASPTYQRGGVVFLTWDEGTNGTSFGQVPMIIISPNLVSMGYTNAQAYSHASYLATVEDLFGLPRLGAAQGAPTLAPFFVHFP